MTANKNTFTKEERLCSLAQIEKLFLEGVSLFSYPFRIIYLRSEALNSPQVKVLFSVPKKRFKLAKDRNRIKRLLRELYRLKKPAFYEFIISRNISLHLALVYTENSILSFKELSLKMDKLFLSLEHHLNA
jgi:ribonuclease P protein component